LISEEKGFEHLLQALAEMDRAGKKTMAQRILTAIATCSPSEELPGDLALRIADLETEGLYCLDSVVRTYALKKRANRMACCGRIQEARNLLHEVIRNYEGTGDRYNQAVPTLDRARLEVDYQAAAPRPRSEGAPIDSRTISDICENSLYAALKRRI
jgi:hypothetical protein